MLQVTCRECNEIMERRDDSSYICMFCRKEIFVDEGGDVC